MLRWFNKQVVAVVCGLCGLALVPVACQLLRTPAPALINYSRIVDLSHVITQDMPHAPAAPPTRIMRDQAAAPPHMLQIGVQSGTHLRVAGSGALARAPLEQLSPQRLVVPAVVLDVRDAAQDHAGFRLSIADVQAWERRHGRIPAGSLVLLNTGWDVRWGDARDYFRSGRSPAPGFSETALLWLLREREVGGIGLDTPLLPPLTLVLSARPAPADDAVLLLGNLTSLEQVPPSGATLVIGALRIQASVASPASVLALVP